MRRRRALHLPRIALAALALFFVAFLTYKLLSAGAPVEVAEAPKTLNKGMPEQEVRQKLGKPAKELTPAEIRNLTGGITPFGTTGWLYVADHERLVVTFLNGRVERWDTLPSGR